MSITEQFVFLGQILWKLAENFSLVFLIGGAAALGYAGYLLFVKKV